MNLSQLINFYSSWNYQNTYGFLLISARIESINTLKLAYYCKWNLATTRKRKLRTLVFLFLNRNNQLLEIYQKIATPGNSDRFLLWCHIQEISWTWKLLKFFLKTYLPLEEQQALKSYSAILSLYNVLQTALIF